MSHGQARQEYCERFMACRDWSSAFIVINPCTTPMHLPFQAFDRKASKSVKVASGGAGPAAAQLCWFVGCGLMAHVGSQVFAWRIGVYRPCCQPTATNGSRKRYDEHRIFTESSCTNASEPYSHVECLVCKAQLTSTTPTKHFLPSCLHPPPSELDALELPAEAADGTAPMCDSSDRKHLRNLRECFDIRHPKMP